MRAQSAGTPYKALPHSRGVFALYTYHILTYTYILHLLRLYDIPIICLLYT